MNPEHLKPLDFMDISGLSRITLHSPAEAETTRLAYHLNGVPFPPNTRGFFYYSAPSIPGSPYISGGVRFRLTSSSSPSAFALGTDLLTPKGLPWEITLPGLVNASSYATLCSQLLNDNLITKEQVQRCQSAFSKWKRWRNLPVVQALDQPFQMSFSSGFKIALLPPTEREAHPFYLQKSFAESRGGRRIVPYEGQFSRLLSPPANHLYLRTAFV